MKSASDLAREICDEFGLHIGMHTKRLQDFINNDRSSTLKRCAEVVRKIDVLDAQAGWEDGDEIALGVQNFIVKAIENIDLEEPK